RFEKRSGVIDLGTSDNGRRNRRYRVLRIPKTVVEKYLVERSGAAVKIEVPPSPKQRRKSPNWKNIAILHLAKIGKKKQREDKARKPASGGAGQKNKYSDLGVVLLNK